MVLPQVESTSYRYDQKPKATLLAIREWPVWYGVLVFLRHFPCLSHSCRLKLDLLLPCRRRQAKQRYNTRVSRGVASFVALKGALENAEIDTVRSFFTSEDEGSWKDFSAAGYLLANAFRTNSSAAPDTIPSVKVSAENTEGASTCLSIDCIGGFTNRSVWLASTTEMEGVRGSSRGDDESAQKERYKWSSCRLRRCYCGA